MNYWYTKQHAWILPIFCLLKEARLIWFSSHDTLERTKIIGRKNKWVVWWIWVWGWVVYKGVVGGNLVMELCIELWFIAWLHAFSKTDRTVHHEKWILLHVKQATSLPGCRRKDGTQIVTNAFNLLQVNCISKMKGVGKKGA